jgi:tRNA(fMet)-specific endonuclease VapC
VAAQQHSCTFSAEKYNYAEIAAHARSEDMILVTNNVREFERVHGLVVENWVE